MRVLAAMVAKDLRRRARAPLATILLLLFPLVFSGIIALTFGTGEVKAPKVRLLLEDRDGGLVGRLVASAFQQGEAQKYFEVKAVEVRTDGPQAPPSPKEDAARIEKEEATALLRLPAGFTDDVLAGRPARIELVKSPAQSILPEVAEQVTTVIAEALSSASRLLRGPLDQIRASSPKGGPSDQRVAEIAVLVNGVVTRSQRYLFPPVITLETGTPPAARGDVKGNTQKPAGSSSSSSVFLFMLPGISVYALFNLADQMMRDLLIEARLKTLRRQLAGPLTAGRVLAGKALSTAVVAAIALVLLTAVGAFAAPGRVSLPGYLLLSAALVAAATGFASFVFGLARGEKQGATLASLLSLVMAFAGGSFIPLNSLPAALRALSPASLMYWAADGYHKLVLDGAGLRGVLPHVAILAGTGLVLLALSAPLWQRRLLRGELS